MKERVLAGLVLLAVLLTASACSKPIRTDAPISSFSFSHSGMHTGLIYTLSAARTEDAWQAELSLLAGEKEYVLEMTEAEAEELDAMIRKHDLNRWNGFDKIDRRETDGTSFELIVNDTVVNGYEINDKGINTGSTLWGNKNSMPKERLNVVVDGVDVY